VASLDADLRRRGVTLWLTNLNGRPLDMVRRYPAAAATAFSARPPQGTR